MNVGLSEDVWDHLVHINGRNQCTAWTRSSIGVPLNEFISLAIVTSIARNDQDGPKYYVQMIKCCFIWVVPVGQIYQIFVAKHSVFGDPRESVSTCPRLLGCLSRRSLCPKSLSATPESHWTLEETNSLQDVT
jgi:hypothetical protein